MDLTRKSAVELLQLLESRAISATECVQHFHDRVARFDDGLGALIAADNGNALELARDIDRRRDRGEKLGKLAGLPIAIKDNICTRRFRTTAGSRMLENFAPPFDATVIRKLVAEDAVIFAKTTMDEFAMGSSTENPHFGNCHNPWNRACVAGGSSGGSAAAVAGGLVPWALGSDTGGSIRQPASFCGIAGLKPTYGRVSRYGLIAFASSLDQIGPLARSTADLACLLEVIAGHDPRDSTSSRQPVPRYTQSLDDSLRGVRIGVCRSQLDELPDVDVRESIRDSIGRFVDLGATITDIELPYEPYAIAAYYIIAPCEASSNLARYDGVRFTTRSQSTDLNSMYSRTRAECFGPEVRNRILLGTFALSSGHYDQYYRRASQVRQLIRQSYDRVFAQVDLIVGPTSPTPAFRIGEKSMDPISMYLADVYTVSANLAGIPALSIPCGFSSKRLPIGLQLQAQPFAEATLLRAAHQYQQITDHWQQIPELNLVD